jgi:pimeloyl-ACP methyl ester carboxylesterase
MRVFLWLVLFYDCLRFFVSTFSPLILSFVDLIICSQHRELQSASAFRAFMIILCFSFLRKQKSALPDIIILVQSILSLILVWITPSIDFVLKLVLSKILLLECGSFVFHRDRVRQRKLNLLNDSLSTGLLLSQPDDHQTVSHQSYTFDGVSINIHQVIRANNPVHVVLLHQFGSAMFTFDELIKYLDCGFTVFDRPGHGNTQKFPGRDEIYSNEFSVNLTTDIINKLSGYKIILVGCGAGAVVAFNTAIQMSPSTISGLFLISPPSNSGLPKMLKTFVKNSTIGKSLTHALLKSELGDSLVKTSWKGKIPSALMDRYHNLTKNPSFIDSMIKLVELDDHRWTETGNLQDIDVAVIIGDSDKLVTKKETEKIIQKLKDSTKIKSFKLHLIKDCGHVPHEETPFDCASIINQYIS